MLWFDSVTEGTSNLRVQYIRLPVYFSSGLGIVDCLVAFIAFNSIDLLFVFLWKELLVKNSWIYRWEWQLICFCVDFDKLYFRGAQTSKNEEKQLHQRAGRILRSAGVDFDEWKDFDWLRKQTLDNFSGKAKIQGYADYYLAKCWNGSKLANEADVTIYSKLLEIDSALGAPVSRQLWACLSWTTRWDIIKVRIKDLGTYNQNYLRPSILDK